MNRLKKLIALMAVTATLSTSAGVLNADSGYAYEGSHKASSVSPLVALGTVAVVATIVVIVKDNHHHSHHGNGSSSSSTTHSHSHSHS